MPIQKCKTAPHIIESFRSEGWDLHQVFGEFIDNSLAEKATFVEIERDKDRIIIRDDGSGIANISDFFDLGFGTNHDNKQYINCYGIGATKAAQILGNNIYVQTVHKGRYKEASFSYDRAKERGELVFDCARPRKARPGEQGTTIIISKLAFGRNFTWQATMERKIGLYFSPALREGQKIRYRKSPAEDWAEVQPVELPIHDSVYSFHGAVNGKGFKGQAGLMRVDEQKDRFNHIFFQFGLRIVEGTRDPFLKGSNLGLLTGLVNLSNDFKKDLGQHKSSIVHGRMELMEAVQKELLPLMKKAELAERGDELRILNEHWHQQMLRHYGDIARPGVPQVPSSRRRRYSSTLPATSPRIKLPRGEEKEEGADVRVRTEDGSQKVGQLVFAIQFDDNITERHEVLTYYNDACVTVSLNTRMPYIQSVMHPRNSDAVWALWASAIAEFVGERVIIDKKPIAKYLPDLDGVVDQDSELSKVMQYVKTYIFQRLETSKAKAV